jgi:hypothetical protein
VIIGDDADTLGSVIGDDADEDGEVPPEFVAVTVNV